jgi:hypothetical protein
LIKLAVKRAVGVGTFGAPRDPIASSAVRLEDLRVRSFRLYESVRAAQRADSGPDDAVVSLMRARGLARDLEAALDDAVNELDREATTVTPWRQPRSAAQ